MPDIAASIRTRLLADASVAALVGTRIQSDVLEQGQTLPAITYQVIDTVPNETLAAISDVSRARVQVDCFGATRGAANALADAVRLSLQMFRGLIGSQFVNGIQMPTGEIHLVDRNEAGTDQRRYITTQDFYVFYRTTTS